jgi:hypothetical protein
MAPPSLEVPAALPPQVSAAVSPSNEQANSFRECVIIRHPRRDGEFAFAFITGQTVLQVGSPWDAGCAVQGLDRRVGGLATEPLARRVPVLKRG